MPDVTEGQLTLSFPVGWKTVKYDDTQWHKVRMRSRLKAMDVLAKKDDNDHWWIEIKDCEGTEDENRPRLSSADSPEVTYTREWVEQKGWKPKVSIARRKAFIIDEVERKFSSTLAAIAVAMREDEAELRGFEVINQQNSPVIKVVLLLTWEPRDFRRLASRLQHKLNQSLNPYGVQGFVVNDQTISSCGLPCQVIRRG